MKYIWEPMSLGGIDRYMLDSDRFLSTDRSTRSTGTGRAGMPELPPYRWGARDARHERIQEARVAALRAEADRRYGSQRAELLAEERQTVRAGNIGRPLKRIELEPVPEPAQAPVREPSPQPEPVTRPEPALVPG